MLGYLRIEKSNLRFKDYYKYKNYYCALCAAMRQEYGLFSCLLLSYDLTFLITVLETVEKYDVHKKIHCPISPLKKASVNISEDILQYCAFINYYLAVVKIRDDELDTNSLGKKILRKILEHNCRYKQHLSQYQCVITRLEGMYARVISLEQEETNLDCSLSAFGEFFTYIFTGYLDYKGMDADDPFISAIQKLFHTLGKWVYIADAYDDLQKDIKSGEYNLLESVYNSDNSPERSAFHKYVSFLVSMLLVNIEATLSELKHIKNHDWYLIDNICTYGCQMTYSHIKKIRYS